MGKTSQWPAVVVLMPEAWPPAGDQGRAGYGTCRRPGTPSAHLRAMDRASSFRDGAIDVPNDKPVGRDTMAWKTPKIVEVPVGMEINMYACAARK
jgi:coenzyme PQQ precursor peptide PqqA